MDFLTPVSNRQTLMVNGMWPKYISMSRNHTGIDIICKKGERINSIVSGKVVKTKIGRRMVPGASEVTILFDDLFIISKHCRPYSGIKKNYVMIAGTPIGGIDRSGISYGAHYHLEMRYAKSGRKLKRGTTVDPVPLLIEFCPDIKLILQPGRWLNKRTGKLMSLEQAYKTYNPDSLKYFSL